MSKKKKEKTEFQKYKSFSAKLENQIKKEKSKNATN